MLQKCFGHIFFLLQVRLLQQAKEAFAGGLPEMEDRSEDIAALKNRWHLCWAEQTSVRPGTKGSSRTGRRDTLLPWESLPRPRRELNFLGDFSQDFYSCLEMAFCYTFFLQQPELWAGWQAQWKGIQAEGKAETKASGFCLGLDLNFCSGARGSNCHPGRGSCRISWQDQPSGKQARQVNIF